ncbi:oxidoreductase [uncultured Corynebacterium sp.]|uniref:oxidoreductase n=1 Tax=uncultured Corynebacterium sp. TaxID=159447 RepID=UPI0025E3B791|nr:oxidoreductase [uncultured Corynebacterium sp.]
MARTNPDIFHGNGSRSLDGSPKVALVTGTTSGIGKSTALKMLKKGFVVYGAARREDRLRELARDGVRTLQMDVTDEGSMREGINTIIDDAGRIDVLINCAGYGVVGAIEDVDPGDARRQFEVNVFGPMALVRLVAPFMREQGEGRIVNVSSIAGKVPAPLGGWYHGSKFALEGLSDCLRLELEPWGIDVSVVEPGPVKTEWPHIAQESLKETSEGGPYADMAHSVAESFEFKHRPGMVSRPGAVARVVVKAATAEQPRTRYAVGPLAKLTVLSRRLLPDRAMDFFIRNSYKLRPTHR